MTKRIRLKYYVGYKAGQSRVFSSATEPTEATHGKLYNAVVGPFRTRHAAEIMAVYGRNNPNCCTVAQAERIANNGGNRG